MVKQEQLQYDGSFEYQGRMISYYITDNRAPIRNEKMSRYTNFYENGKNLGVRAIYGHVDKMTNITNYDAKRWFEEYAEKEPLKWK